uniref:Uncharacterized protein n=1 Tax=Serinus canaria TaxID=9135 RepID=A0A8C9MJC1_SERCA
MFHLFSHCWSWLQAIQEPVRKVTLLVMGLDNAGKTSVITDIERGEEGHGPETPQTGAAASWVSLLHTSGSVGWQNHQQPGLTKENN